jgi:hypothetical protein
MVARWRVRSIVVRAGIAGPIGCALCQALMPRVRKPECNPLVSQSRLTTLRLMRRTRVQRFFAGLFGLWMTITVSGVSLQACPEHGGGWLGGVVDTGMHHDTSAPMTADMAAAMVGGHHGHDGDAPGAGHGGHHGHQCTCPGACCTTGLVSVPPGRLVAIPVVPVVVAAAAPLVFRDVAPRAAPDVVIPPPLGPPAQSV